MPRTKAGKRLLATDRYMGSYLEGSLHGPEPRDTLREVIEEIENEAFEMGRRQAKRDATNVEAVE